MRKETVKTGIKLLIFLTLLLGIVLGLNVLMKPKWCTRYASGTNIRGFYEMPENSVDVLVLGSSNVICGVNANLMFEEYGIAAYTCGTEIQPIFGSYALLREAMRLQDIQAVVLDVGDLFDEFDEAGYRKTFDYMHLSALKLELLQEYRHSIYADMDLFSYVLPLMTYHSRFDELSNEDLRVPSESLRGHYIRTEQRGRSFSGIGDTGNVAAKEIPAENRMALEKIIRLCEERDIALLLICGPSARATAAEHNAAAVIAQEYGLTFLDFNQPECWPEIDYGADMADIEHFNTAGANKATRRIVEALQALGSLPDRSKDAFQQELAQRYKHAWEQALLQADQA